MSLTGLTVASFQNHLVLWASRLDTLRPIWIGGLIVGASKARAVIEPDVSLAIAYLQLGTHSLTSRWFLTRATVFTSPFHSHYLGLRALNLDAVLTIRRGSCIVGAVLARSIDLRQLVQLAFVWRATEHPIFALLKFLVFWAFLYA